MFSTIHIPSIKTTVTNVYLGTSKMRTADQPLTTLSERNKEMQSRVYDRIRVRVVGLCFGLFKVVNGWSVLVGLLSAFYA